MYTKNFWPNEEIIQTWKREQALKEKRSSAWGNSSFDIPYDQETPPSDGQAGKMQASRNGSQVLYSPESDQYILVNDR